LGAFCPWKRRFQSLRTPQRSSQSASCYRRGRCCAENQRGTAAESPPRIDTTPQGSPCAGTRRSGEDGDHRETFPSPGREKKILRLPQAWKWDRSCRFLPDPGAASNHGVSLRENPPGNPRSSSSRSSVLASNQLRTRRRQTARELPLLISRQQLRFHHAERDEGVSRGVFHPVWLCASVYEPFTNGRREFCFRWRPARRPPTGPTRIFMENFASAGNHNGLISSTPLTSASLLARQPRHSFPSTLPW